MTERNLRINLMFDTPEQIGQYLNEPDFLEITFYGILAFVDTAGRAVYPETRLREVIGPQTDPGVIKAVEDLGKSA